MAETAGHLQRISPAPTPGPWHARIVAGLACVIAMAGRRQVAGYTRPADAVLMAAAPDLLAVADEFLRLWGAGFEDEEGHARLARLAEAAVAKARGPADGRPWEEGEA